MNSNQAPRVAADDVNLLPFVNALINARWWIAGSILVFAAVTWYWAQSKPYLYESSARVSIVDIEDPGGVAPDDRRASEVLTLVEHGFVMGTTHDNYNDVMRARLNSRKFTMRFLDQHNVYRFFYPEHWSEAQQAWRDGFQPDRGAAFTRFRDEVRSITRDEETDIITVAMTWPDPMVARDWANLYVASFNEFIRERTMEDVRRKQAFLESELRRSDVLEIQQSIYRLIEAQTAIAMLASARDEYALEIIDPAAVPYRSFNMSRKKRVVIGAIAGGLLAAFAALAWVVLAQMLQTIRNYRAEQAAAAAAQSEQ
jgi:uncharacterized protein involved in exopolysaccharide biosynthesis